LRTVLSAWLLVLSCAAAEDVASVRTPDAGVASAVAPAVAPVSAPAATPAAVQASDLSDFANRLSGIPDRGMGEPGALVALDRIEARLQAAGITCWRIPTTVSVPVVRHATLTLDGVSWPVVPLGANRAATATATVTGPLVELGAVHSDAFDGHDVRGAIVVLDASGAERWRDCAAAGAAAVVVRGARTLDAAGIAALSCDATLPFPRVACDLPPVPPVVGASAPVRTATLTVEQAWEPRTAWSLVGLVPGRSKALEAVLVSAGYEADGPVSALTPGATRAWNAALLVELAERLARTGSERTVLVAFTGARAEMFRGQRELAVGLTAPQNEDHALVLDAKRATAASAQLDALAAGLAAPPGDAAPTAMSLADACAAHMSPPASLDDVQALSSALAALLADAASQVADVAEARVAALRNAPAAARASDHTAALTAAVTKAQALRTRQQRLDRHQFAEAGHVEDLLPMAAPAARRAADLAARERDRVIALANLRQALGAAEVVHALAFDLSDGNRRFAAVTTGFAVTWKADTGWIHRGLARTASLVHATAYDTAVDAIPGDRAAFWSDGYLHDTGTAGVFLPSATLSTTDDARPRLGSPLDDAGHFGADAFRAQADDALALTLQWIDSPELTARRFVPPDVADAVVRAEIRATGTASGRRALPFAHVWLAYSGDGGTPWSGDVRRVETRWCDHLGEAPVPSIPTVPGVGTGAGLVVRVYAYDDHGAVRAVPSSGGLQGGGLGMVKLDGHVRDVLAPLFPAVPSSVHGLVDPRLLQSLTSIGVLSAARQAAPDLAHVELDDSIGAVWSEAGRRIMLTATQGRGSHRLLILGETDKDGTFTGRDPGQLSTLTPRDAAADLWRLDEQRLAAMRRSSVEPLALTDLHAQAGRFLAAADEALAAGHRQEAEGAALSAWSFAARVYPGVLGAGNDVVHGLVLLLSLAVPCAWMLERLLIAASTVLRRALGFAAMFGLLFGVLFLIHPAAGLATTPLVVLLAFLIILMSGSVAVVLHVRFEREMAQLRDRGLPLRADMARLGALVATIELGAGNMRRRPLRTVLTVTTVALMAFTLLTFAGFNPDQSVRAMAGDGPAPFDGVLVRRNGWAPLHDRAPDLLAIRWGDRTEGWPLRWLVPNGGAKRMPVSGPAGTSSVLGVVGLSARDPSGADRALVRGTGPDAPRGLGDLPADGRDWMFLPAEVLRRCGLAPGDPFSWRGVPLRAGLVEGRALADAITIGGEALTPLASDSADGQILIDRLNLPAADGAPRVETASFAHQDPGSVAVMRDTTAARLGAALVAVTLTPRSVDTDLDLLARDMAQQLSMTLRLGRHGETKLLTAVGRLTADGLGGALVPLLLGGLIVFATMLGAVAERGREIFIYTSLGLAPLHIAALFLVEAAIYAVLGALGGYILAQSIAILLGWSANLGLIAAAPDLDYSSTSAMLTILLVMTAVLCSALYPAWVASRSARPSGETPKLPAPAGDRWEVPFPVTVPQRDARAVMAYLSHWLSMAGEVGELGFTAGEVALGEAPDGVLKAKIWLAPFDLGLSQTLTVESEPIDLPGSCALRVVLDLRSGGRSDWRRANQTFLKELRRQVLSWRSLTHDQRERFRAKAGDDDAMKRWASGEYLK
jgi:hypothetical protein